MLTVGFAVYLLLAMFGPWADHSGAGAFFVFVIWTVVMLYALVLAFLAPWWPSKLGSMIIANIWGKEAGRAALNIFDMIDLAVNGVFFIVPTLIFAAVSTGVYFLGWGDDFVKSVSKYMTAGGIVIAIAYLLLETWWMLDRFSITDEIKSAMPKVKTTAQALAVETSSRAVALWNKNYPRVRARSRSLYAETSMQGRAFYKMTKGICRYCGIRIDVFRRSRDVVANVGSPALAETSDRLLAARSRLGAQKIELARLWQDCRWFAVTVAILAVLALLFLWSLFA